VLESPRTEKPNKVVVSVTLNSQINKVLKKLYPKLVPTSMEDPYKLMYLNLVKLEDQEVLEDVEDSVEGSVEEEEDPTLIWLLRKVLLLLSKEKRKGYDLINPTN
jgi:hypothetical protein